MPTNPGGKKGTLIAFEGRGQAGALPSIKTGIQPGDTEKGIYRILLPGKLA